MRNVLNAEEILLKRRVGGERHLKDVVGILSVNILKKSNLKIF